VIEGLDGSGVLVFGRKSVERHHSVVVGGLDGAAAFTLTALPLLSLSCNQLSRTIPSSLTDLTALEFLYLEDNQLTGTVPFCNGAERTQSHNVFVG
jgi:hypothetical protein